MASSARSKKNRKTSRKPKWRSRCPVRRGLQPPVESRSLKLGRWYARSRQPDLAARAVDQELSPATSPKRVGEERKLLEKRTKAEFDRRGSWDVLLFSGGGNGIVDNPMALWVKDSNPAIPAVQHLNTPRFTAALDLVRAADEDLIALRDAHGPPTTLIFHDYDFAIPDGRCVCF